MYPDIGSNPAEKEQEKEKTLNIKIKSSWILVNLGRDQKPKQNAQTKQEDIQDYIKSSRALFELRKSMGMKREDESPLINRRS